MKAKKKKRLRWLIVLLIVLALAGSVLLRSGDSTIYAETKVTTGDISTTYSFTGSMVSPHTQTVAATTAGKVREIYVEANQQVQDGDRLVKLSDGQTIRADIDGEVVSLPVSEEDTVAPGQTLMVVMDVENMEVQISVDEYDVEAIEIGREAAVTINALDVTCEGTVKSFEKLATSMGTMAAYSARIELEAPEKALPGMQVEVEMLNQSAENALLLKMDALQFDDKNQPFVLTKDTEGEYAVTYVETGITDGSTVQILSGLSDGQTVYYVAGIDMAALMAAMRGGR